MIFFIPIKITKLIARKGYFRFKIRSLKIGFQKSFGNLEVLILF